MFQEILTGALPSDLLSAICDVYVTLTTDTTDGFGFKARDFWWLALLLAGIFGLVSALNLNASISGLYGLLITSAITAVSYFALDGKFDENLSKFWIF